MQWRLLVGGVSKGEILQRLVECGVCFNDYARELFAAPEFVPSQDEREVEVVAVSLDDLGLGNGGTYPEIVARAGAQGLVECELEIAPHLRLHLLDQPKGPYLTVASVKLRDDEEFPNGLYLRHLDDGLWLRGYNAGMENHYAVDFSDFVFVKSTS